MKNPYIGFCTESHELSKYIQENSLSLYSRCFGSKISFASILSLVVYYALKSRETKKLMSN